METVKCLECLLILQHSLVPKKIFFQRVWGGGGGVDNTRGNSGGVDGLFLCQKMEIPWRREGLREIPTMVGVWTKKF